MIYGFMHIIIIYIMHYLLFHYLLVVWLAFRMIYGFMHARIHARILCLFVVSLSIVGSLACVPNDLRVHACTYPCTHSLIICCFIIYWQTRQKAKLWGKIKQVLQRRNSVFGNTFLIKLIGVTKQLWVQESDLSCGVAASFKAGKPLPTTAKALVNRKYADEQKQYLSSQDRTNREDVCKVVKKVFGGVEL